MNISTQYNNTKMHAKKLVFVQLFKLQIHETKYIKTKMQTYIHTYIDTYKQKYMHTCIHTYMHTYIKNTYNIQKYHTRNFLLKNSSRPIFTQTYMHTNLWLFIHTNIHTYINGYIQCIPAYIRTRLQTFKRLCISTLTACIHLFMHTHIQSTHTCIYMHKYRRMRIHINRHKISVPFCFLQNDVPTYTHIYYITQIFHGNHSFQTTIRSFSCSFFFVRISQMLKCIHWSYMGKNTLLTKPQISDLRKKLLKVKTHKRAILNTVRVLAYCFNRDARRLISSESSLVASTYRIGRMRK